MAAKSGWKQRAIVYVSRNSFIRRAYTELKNAPLFGPVLQKLVKAMVPSGTRVWLQIPAGLGEGLWMHLDPRFEMDYAAGAYEPMIVEAMVSEFGITAARRISESSAYWPRASPVKQGRYLRSKRTLTTRNGSKSTHAETVWTKFTSCRTPSGILLENSHFRGPQ